MFDRAFLTKLKNFIIFFIIYTLCFFAFFKTLKYTLPFVIAFFIAVMIKPITNYLNNRFKIKKGIIGIVLSILIIAILFTSITFILIKLTNELKLLLNEIPNVDTIYQYIEKPIKELGKYFNQIDGDIVQKIHKDIFTYTSKFLDFTMNTLNVMLSIAIKVPLFFMILFITLISTYFFTNDLHKIEDKFFSMFSKDGQGKVKTIFQDINKIIFGYIKSYSIIICVTFIETFTGFYILNIEYAIVFSVLAALFDILPLIGVGIIYFPLVIYSIFCKNYIAAIGIIILYVVVNIIRQIIEPKLLSTNIGIHPILMIMSLFIGLQLYGFTGVIYFVLLIVLYNALKKVDIL